MAAIGGPLMWLRKDTIALRVRISLQMFFYACSFVVQTKVMKAELFLTEAILHTFYRQMNLHTSLFRHKSSATANSHREKQSRALKTSARRSTVKDRAQSKQPTPMWEKVHDNTSNSLSV